MKKILFVSGTRADFGKIKSLVKEVESSKDFDCFIFVTGMHLLDKYGYTINEIYKSGFKNIYPYQNQNETKGESMDLTLANTIKGFARYVKELRPDLIVVHGDRLEAMAGAIVGVLNDVLVAHIEGGELSGTVDEVIRHSISKLAHIHFVSNSKAYKRLKQLGEDNSKIYQIGSPEVDIMVSQKLPNIDDVKKSYEIFFKDYSIFIYHPVTTELENIDKNINFLIDAMVESQKNYVVIYPNNDHGSNNIISALKKIENNPRFRLIPSFKFESFITLLKNANFIVGNSSCGVREASILGVCSINVGTRQNRRNDSKFILNIEECSSEIHNALIKDWPRIEPSYDFGEGGSAKNFIDVISKKEFWKTRFQKNFYDI